MTPRVWKLVAIVAAVIAFALLAWSIWDHETVMRTVERARPVPFFLVMVLLPMLTFPVTPFFLLAGARFGVIFGLLMTASALMANLALCYALARWLRPMVSRVMQRLDYPPPSLGKRSPTRFTIATRFLPGVPSAIKNYTLGVAGVPFGLYLGISLGVTALYAIPLVVLGESLFDHDVLGALPAVLLLMAMGGVVLWRRRRRIQDVDVTV
jgi:uncharacterized membrane protein YdjX (TVP38/TMEM64 family)